MEKSQPPYYTGGPTAPAEGYTPPQGEYPQGVYPQGGYPQGGYAQGGYPPQHAGYSSPPTYPQGVYPPAGGYPPQSGYPSQPGYPPVGGYPGYPPQSGPQSIPTVQPGYPPQPGHAPPPQVIITTAPVVTPQRRRGWCENNQRNKPQSNSQSAASMIFTSGGMSLAWSVGFHPQYTYLSKAVYTHMQVCWFVAVIIGSLLSALLVTKLKKRIFNYLSSILVLVNGILYTSAPDNVTAIIVARYCDGIAFGLSLIPAIVSGSEQSVKGLRGRVLSIEQTGLSTGIMLKTIYMNFWGYNWYFNSNQMHGILAIVYGAIALLFTVIFTIDSPIFYLRKNDETEAMNCLRRLQRPQEVTNETYALLAEDKLVVQEDDVRGRSQNISIGIVPVIKVGLFRAFVAMSFTLPLTWALFLSSVFSSYYASEWTTYTYGIMRLIGTFIAIFTLDSMGRKVLSAFSLLVGGGLLIGVGSLFSSYWNLTQPGKMDTVVGFLLTYQIFAGIAAPSSTCYLGEAFSISVKPLFIFIAITIENIVQIIIVCSFANNISSTSDYAYAVGVLQLIFAIFFFAVMPETKNTTVREALAKFKKSLNLGTS